MLILQSRNKSLAADRLASPMKRDNPWMKTPPQRIYRPPSESPSPEETNPLRCEQSKHFLFLWTISVQVSSFFTAKALSFLHYFCSFFYGECINVHCVWISFLSLEFPMFSWFVPRVVFSEFNWNFVAFFDNCCLGGWPIRTIPSDLWMGLEDLASSSAKVCSSSVWRSG